LPVIFTVVITLIEHDLNARLGRVASLGKRSIAVVPVGFKSVLAVEDHRVHGVDRKMNVGFTAKIHERFWLP
jgi:hypothetical protein